MARAYAVNSNMKKVEQGTGAKPKGNRVVRASGAPRRTVKSRKPASKAKRPATKAGKPANAGTRAKSSPKGGATSGAPASRLIEQRVRELGGWRGETLARMRALILEADPGMIEEWKWMGTPVWSHDGIVCTGEAYAKVVKHTFARGASLPDPSRLFNSSLEGNTRRAIDIHEGQQIDASAFKALVKAAVARNQNRPSAKKR
jgi:hypothetical protein